MPLAISINKAKFNENSKLRRGVRTTSRRDVHPYRTAIGTARHCVRRARQQRASGCMLPWVIITTTAGQHNHRWTEGAIVDYMEQHPSRAYFSRLFRN
eukprot:scaffold118240_cov87-Phaeocystis_antarctica.AAC.1